MKPTVHVPVKEIEPFLKRALEYIKQDNTNKWNKKVDKFWADVEGKRHFWFFKLKYPTRADVEDALGKPEEGKTGIIGTTWNLIRGATHQVIMYRQLLSLFEHDPEKVVTMLVSQYVSIMSFDEAESEVKDKITTDAEYFSRDDES